MSRLIVTAAPPTSNGDLHIGHLSGPYLGADVFARARRQLGDDVLLVSYSDDNQSYVQRKALQQGTTPSAIARRFGTTIADTLLKSNIKLDHFLYSLDNPILVNALHRFYEAAKADNVLSRKEAEIPYFDTYQVWGYEAFARGSCPNCGGSTDTSQCESCAFPPVIEDMTDIRCILDGSAARKRKVEQIFLDIEAHRPLLTKLCEHAKFRPQLAAFMDEVLSQPMRPWAISRPHDYGPPVPDDPSATLHTWFGGIAGYYATSQEWAKKIGQPERWRDYWENPECGIVHFIGFDCSFSHAVVYPSLLSHLPMAPSVIQIFTNKFLLLQGHGFSTSRGLAIWANEFLDYVEADALRYFLALNAPETQETNFDLADFQRTINTDLHDVFAQAITALESNRMAVAAEVGIVEERLNPLRTTFLQACSVEDFSLTTMAKVLQSIIGLIRRAKPAELYPLLAVYATVAQALQPSFSKQLARYLRLPKSWGRDWLLTGKGLRELSPLASSADGRPEFARVSDSVVRKFQHVIDSLTLTPA
ncbi:MAG TPA: class I tRNA ligase family protein [Dongiaceae bacterium]|jgi:methionyl-tRNA synthetase|nr:class I tRNA ligase family protein [Dongiaceae bacterium]